MVVCVLMCLFSAAFTDSMSGHASTDGSIAGQLTAVGLSCISSYEVSSNKLDAHKYHAPLTLQFQFSLNNQPFYRDFTGQSVKYRDITGNTIEGKSNIFSLI